MFLRMCFLVGMCFVMNLYYYYVLRIHTSPSLLPLPPPLLTFLLASTFTYRHTHTHTTSSLSHPLPLHTYTHTLILTPYPSPSPSPHTQASITLPDVTVVIDTCRVKEISFDAEQQMSSLEMKKASQDSLRQRRGRAGRVQVTLLQTLI